MVLVACHHPKAPPSASVPKNEVWVTHAQLTEGRFSFVTATEQDVDATVSATGRIAFDDRKVSHVFSPVTGRVVAIHAQFGDKLKKGDPLVSIDSPDVGVASADLDKAHADVVAAEREYLRQKELYEAHASPQKDFQAAENEYRKANAEEQRALKKAKLLRAGTIDQVTQKYVLRASIDGEVVARNVNPGLEVQGQYFGGTSVELFTIGSADTVWVLADIFEMDLSRVTSGQKVEVRVVSYPDRVFAGTVDWIAGTLEPATRTAKARCTIANPEHLLKPEMFASVFVRVPPKRGLTLPRRAVLRLGDQTVAFIDLGGASDGRQRFARRVVSVAEDEPGDTLPVLRGIRLGDRVVVDGALFLSELL
jgi:cobalt-zinc-cadmium efflux system membrane fusion protein